MSDQAVARLARAVEALRRADEAWPIIGSLIKRANDLGARARAGDSRWTEARALDAFVDALDDLAAAYDELPFEVRFPLSGARAGAAR